MLNHILCSSFSLKVEMWHQREELEEAVGHIGFGILLLPQT